MIGGLEKVVYCEVHNGRFVCSRLSRSVPKQDEAAYSPVPKRRRNRHFSEFLAEEKARRERDAEEGKNRPHSTCLARRI